MYNASALVPAKFLVLLSHFIALVVLTWNSEETVKICLWEPQPLEMHQNYKKQLLVGMSLSLGLIAIELIAFLTGITMFNTSSTLLSIACHFSACVALYNLVFEEWECGLFWWIFSCFSVVPVLNDLYIVLDTFINKKF